MRGKLLLGGLGVLVAVLTPLGLASEGSMQALNCPASQLATACGVADVAVNTVCYQGVPSVPTVAFVTVRIDGGPLVPCPTV